MDIFTHWVNTIDNTKISKLDTLVVQLDQDTTLDDSTKELLRDKILERKLIHNIGDSPSQDEGPWYKDNYIITDNKALPSYKSLLGNLSYLDWLRTEFIGKFVHLPEPDIQSKIYITMLFINSKVIPDNTALGKYYIYSKQPDSGKSTLARFASYHYPKERIAWLPPDITPGGLRGELDKACGSNQPAFCWFDNWQPNISLPRIGYAWGRLVAYTKAESKVSISSGQGKEMIDFHTHGLHCFTSIWPFDNKTKELKSRSFILFAEPSPIALLSLDHYDWSGLPWEYFNIWGDYDKINSEFSRIFTDCLYHQPKHIKNRQWQITIYPMAIGVYLGLFSSITEAELFYAKYWAWVDESMPANKAQPLELLIEEYCTRIHAEECEKEYLRLDGINVDWIPNRIFLNNIYKWLSTMTTVSRGPHNDQKISDIMDALGWRSSMYRNKHGKVVGIAFYKD